MILSFIMSILIVSPNSVPMRSVTIDGKEYRNGFYPDYFWFSRTREDYYSRAPEEVPGIQVGAGTYYPVPDEKYEFYQNKDFSNKAGGELYCLEEQWDDAHNYYTSAENYRFIIVAKNWPYPFWGSWGDWHLKGNMIRPKWDMFDQLLQGAYAIDDLNWVRDYVGKSTTLELPESSIEDAIFYSLEAFSVDSPYLSSLAVSLFLHDGELYYWVGSDSRYDFVTGIDKEDMYYFTPVDGKVGDYFAGIIETLAMPLKG